MLRVIIIIFIPILRVNIVHFRLFISSIGVLMVFFLRFFKLTRLRLVKDIGLELYFLDLWEALLVLVLVDHKDPHWWLVLSGIGAFSCVVVLGGRPISVGLVASDAGIGRTWWSCTCCWPAWWTCGWSRRWTWS